jgi:hypothetical protein
MKTVLPGIKVRRTLAAVAVMVALPLGAAAQEPSADAAPQQPASAADHDDHDLAKKLANPISDLVSIPFQFNWDEGVGPNDDLRFLLAMQPVLPMSVSENWNMIGRFIVPVMAQPTLFPGGEPQFGTGDISLSAFFSPKKGGTLWGVGPVFVLPTSTDPVLGSGQWSMGPTAVVVVQTAKGTTFGALAYQTWSFAATGNVERDAVNQMYLQPFISHSWKNGVTLGLNSETTINWDKPSGGTMDRPAHRPGEQADAAGSVSLQHGRRHGLVRRGSGLRTEVEAAVELHRAAAQGLAWRRCPVRFGGAATRAGRLIMSDLQIKRVRAAVWNRIPPTIVFMPYTIAVLGSRRWD